MVRRQTGQRQHIGALGLERPEACSKNLETGSIFRKREARRIPIRDRAERPCTTLA